MPPPGFSWPEGGVTRVPFQVFSDKEIYAKEQEKIFRGPVWHYLCMESEVRKPGDIKTTWPYHEEDFEKADMCEMLNIDEPNILRSELLQP
jgi:hypothetical protein